MKLMEDEINSIKIVYKDINIKDKNLIGEEINSAIKYFEKTYKCTCCTYVKKIEVNSKEMLSDNNEKVSGKFIPSTRTIELGSEISNLNKYKNVIIHELCHAKFNIDLLIKEQQLFNLYIKGDITIYLINEYIACRESIKYSYDMNEINIFYDCKKDYKLFEDYKYDIKKNKSISYLIVMIILSENLLRDKKIKMEDVFVKEITDIKEKLEKVEFIPDLKQYIDIREQLNKSNFKYL